MKETPTIQNKKQPTNYSQEYANCLTLIELNKIQEWTITEEARNRARYHTLNNYRKFESLYHARKKQGCKIIEKFDVICSNKGFLYRNENPITSAQEVFLVIAKKNLENYFKLKEEEKINIIINNLGNLNISKETVDEVKKYLENAAKHLPNLCKKTTHQILDNFLHSISYIYLFPVVDFDFFVNGMLREIDRKEMLMLCDRKTAA